MKTQRLNLLEAMNFALAGHEVKCYTEDYTLKLKKGNLAVYHPTVRKGILIGPHQFKKMLDLQWHAGDDRTIKGYYEEE